MHILFANGIDRNQRKEAALAERNSLDNRKQAQRAAAAKPPPAVYIAPPLPKLPTTSANVSLPSTLSAVSYHSASSSGGGGGSAIVGSGLSGSGGGGNALDEDDMDRAFLELDVDGERNKNQL
jgi:hypothetical protein